MAARAHVRLACVASHFPQLSAGSKDDKLHPAANADDGKVSLACQAKQGMITSISYRVRSLCSVGRPRKADVIATCKDKCACRIHECSRGKVGQTDWHDNWRSARINNR